MSIRSKNLLTAAMTLRPQHKKFTGNLNAKYVNKLVKTTEPPVPLIYKIHPFIPNLTYNYPHP